MKPWFRNFVTTLLSLFFITYACISNKSVASNINSDGIVSPLENSSLYLDIYSNIIQPNCAIPACHDGNFEPNFTTPQSTYYTTVMHKVIKNSWDDGFKYRIAPKDTSNSLLFERITNCCFLNDNDRMPVLLPPLTQAQIDSIGFWIMEGAPNWNGEFTYAK